MPLVFTQEDFLVMASVTCMISITFLEFENASNEPMLSYH